MMRKALLLTAVAMIVVQVKASVGEPFKYGEMPTFNAEVNMSLHADRETGVERLILMETKSEPDGAERAETAKLMCLYPASLSSPSWTWMRTNEGVKPYKVMDDLTFVGVPLFVAGIIAKSEKKAFRQNDGTKHVLLTEFKTRIDDYTQYFGPAVTLGLKIGGVEGRSDWGRLLASSAMSYGIMAILVNSIKYTSKEMRPDGSSANSWPSGHTATSFAGATILHKEYGLTRSPWYSIAGYGVATATGVMRVLNNRHWVSDVLSGAGIGILSTELAYALSDILFKGKGLLRNDLNSDANIVTNPSFFSVSMGVGFGSKKLDFDLEKFDLEGGEDSKVLNLKFGTSTAVAAEGAYFFNKYIGVGGRLRVNSSPIKGWDGVEQIATKDIFRTILEIGNDDMAELLVARGTPGTPDYQPGIIDDFNLKIQSDHLTEFAADLGLYFNLPLSDRFALGSKLLVGRSIMQELNLDAVVSGGMKDFDFEEDPNDEDNFFVRNVRHLGNYSTEWDYFTVGGNKTFKVGTGISLTYAYKSNFAWKIFCDYDYTRKTYTMTYNPGAFIIDALPNISSLMGLKYSDTEETQRIKKARNTFVLGGSFVINF
ncbi:phosphatase PAP2 family protein [Prevotella sp. Rep29]|uniref:phosphatase PAP2 family protein n=1 Tax=Prevotella sp. Rep29 TaxID=2691580 RepID=UPI001C6F4666|nr:phosphatase PAP2 family protein [Prevotella sp. Rep29]QYR11010.1 phosphatase PAP2 family protein [Prevotella sp. Rep29]